MNNIILIGMPGVGKSTLGVVLAKMLGYQFIDSDLIIQNQQQKLLQEIINEEGIDSFIKIENTINASIQATHSIIATGGSVVYGTEAMNHLCRIGTVIYLKLSFELLSTRLSDIKGRGVVLREEQTLLDIYRERTVLYEKYADLIIDEEGLTVEETLQLIIDSLVIAASNKKSI